MTKVSQLSIEARDVDDVTVLVLTGKMVLDDGDLLFWAQIKSLLERGRTKILVDVGGVTFIDSAGVGMLVVKRNDVRAKNGDMKLVNLTSHSQRLFGMMKLFTVFETFDNEAAALRSFARK